MISAADFLRKIEARQVDRRGRHKPVPESRLRSFAGAREVKAATADYADAVAATVAAANRHGADVGDVWREGSGAGQ